MALIRFGVRDIPLVSGGEFLTDPAAWLAGPMVVVM